MAEINNPVKLTDPPNPNNDLLLRGVEALENIAFMLSGIFEVLEDIEESLDLIAGIEETEEPEQMELATEETEEEKD